MRRLRDNAPGDPSLGSGERHQPPLWVLLVADVPLPRRGWIGDRTKRLDTRVLAAGWGRWAPLVEAAEAPGVAACSIFSEACSVEELLEDYEDAPDGKSSLRMCLLNGRERSPIFGSVGYGLLVLDLDVPPPPPVLDRIARAVGDCACPTLLRVPNAGDVRERLAGRPGAEWVFPIEGDPVAAAARAIRQYRRSGWPGDLDGPAPSPFALDVPLAMLAARLASWALLYARWVRRDRRARPSLVEALNESMPPDRLVWIDEAGSVIGTPLRCAGFRVVSEAVGTSVVELAIEVELHGHVHERRFELRVDEP